MGPLIHQNCQLTLCGHYKAVCVDSVVLFDLSFLDFCSMLVEFIAACSGLTGFSLLTAGGRLDWLETFVGGETTTLSTGSLAVLSDTMT